MLQANQDRQHILIVVWINQKTDFDNRNSNELYFFPSYGDKMINEWMYNSLVTGSHPPESQKYPSSESLP